jgi:hypothetical protein
MGIFGDIGRTIFGGGGQTGLLGTGQGPAATLYQPEIGAYIDPNDAAMRAQLAQGLAQSQSGNAPLGGEDLFRAAQLNQMGALQAQAAGTGPSVAQDQLTQATNQNIAQQQGMMASQHGINAGLAARLGAQNAANIGQQAANQSSQLKAQEQMAGQAGLAGALSAGRTGDVNAAGAINQNQQFYVNAQAQQDEANRQALMARQAAIAGQQSQMNQTNATSYADAAKGRQALVKGLGAALVGG